MTPNPDSLPEDVDALLRDADPDTVAAYPLPVDALERLARTPDGDPARALEILGRMASRRAHDPQIARLLHRLADDDDAATARRARRIVGSLARWESYPETPVAPLVLAIDAARRDENLAAWADAARALTEAAPWHPRGWTEWGFVQESRECWSGARDAWERVCALRPDAPDGHILRARALSFCGQGDDALEALDRCAARWPGNAFAHFERAALLERRGEHAPAQDAYRRAAEIAPSEAAWWGVIRCAIACDDWMAVSEADAGLIALDPDDPGAWTRYSYALARANAWELSSEAAWEAGRRDPDGRATGELPGAVWLRTEDGGPACS